MPVRRVLANPRIAADIGRVALQRGPLVYCVESIDNGGERTNAIVLPDDAKFLVEKHADLLGGLNTITTEAAIAYESAWGQKAKTRPIQLTAIPYYAWANRGAGSMDLWLARSADAATPLPFKGPADSAEITASVKSNPKALAAIRDGRSGPSSDSRETPRFSWPDTNGGSGWIEYKFPKPTTLSHSKVDWAVDRRAQVYWGARIRGEDLALPASWSIEYLDGADWKPIETIDSYTLRLDTGNEIAFKPVETTALRLQVKFGATRAAVQEWKVE